MKRILLALLFAAAPLRAHDFWIEPSTFTPAVGETVTAGLRVGEHFAGDPVPRSSERLASFTAHDAQRHWDVAGVEYEDPAGLLRIEREGLTVVGYRSNPYTHAIDVERFCGFLEEEGVEGLRVAGCGLRAEQRLEPATRNPQPVLERFTRYAKALLVAGSSSERDRVLGWRCELVREGDGVFRLLYEGKPLADVLVVALHRDGGRLSGRTDAEGRVTLPLDRKGAWLVKAVQVVRAPAGSGADWESLWPSLTFAR